MSLRCLPSSLGSICIAVWEEMPFEEFQNGCCGSHLVCQNGTNLAVLNLMSPQCLPPSCSLIRLIVPSWPPWWPSWILERKEFSNSKSPCHPNTSKQVWAQSDLLFGSRHALKNFKMATVVAILDIGAEQI